MCFRTVITNSSLAFLGEHRIQVLELLKAVDSFSFIK